MQDAGTAIPIKTFVCPSTYLQRTSGMAEEESKLKPPAPILSCRPSVGKYTPNTHPFPEELGKSSALMERRAKQVGFSRAFIESLVPYNLNSFPKEDHVATPILNYMIEHGVLSDMPRYMNSVEIKTALNYGTHSSTVKENSFVRKELDNKTRSGHVAIFQWEDVKHLQGLWLHRRRLTPEVPRGKTPGAGGRLTLP